MTTSTDTNGNATITTTNNTNSETTTTTVNNGETTTVNAGEVNVAVDNSTTGTVTTVEAGGTGSTPGGVTTAEAAGTGTTVTTVEEPPVIATPPPPAVVAPPPAVVAPPPAVVAPPPTSYTPPTSDDGEPPAGETAPGYTSGIAGISGLGRPTASPYYQAQQVGDYSFYKPQPGVDQSLPLNPQEFGLMSYLSPTGGREYGYGYRAPNADLEYLQRLAKIQGTGAEQLPSEDLMGNG